MKLNVVNKARIASSDARLAAWSRDLGDWAKGLLAAARVRVGGLEPKTYRYFQAAWRRRDPRRMRVLAGEWRRFGYRRLHILLAREGARLNYKRLFRLYREERLGVRKRGGRKRALGTRSPMALLEAAN